MTPAAVIRTVWRQPSGTSQCAPGSHRSPGSSAPSDRPPACPAARSSVRPRAGAGWPAPARCPRSPGRPATAPRRPAPRASDPCAAVAPVPGGAGRGGGAGGVERGQRPAPAAGRPRRPGPPAPGVELDLSALVAGAGTAAVRRPVRHCRRPAAPPTAGWPLHAGLAQQPLAARPARRRPAPRRSARRCRDRRRQAGPPRPPSRAGCGPAPGAIVLLLHALGRDARRHRPGRPARLTDRGGRRRRGGRGRPGGRASGCGW